MIQYVFLPGGDCALIVNDLLVMTADPDFESTKLVESTAERLSEALDVALQRIAMPWPSDAEWNWDEILESMNQKKSHENQTPG